MLHLAARYFGSFCAEEKIPFFAFGWKNEIGRSSENCLEIQHAKRIFPVFGVDEVKKNFEIFEIFDNAQNFPSNLGPAASG